MTCITHFISVLVAVLLLMAPATHAQQSEMFGPYELHYSVVNTSFLEPAIATRYGITRGENRAILNLSVRQHLADGSRAEPRSMLLKGTTRDLLQKSQTLEFQEIREGPAVYYIAQFKFINEEWRFFEVDFRPEGADKTYRFELKHQLYFN